MTAASYADWLARGRNHQWLGRPLDALQCFRRALRESPRPTEARFHLGETFWQLGRLDEALAALDQATSFAPEVPDAWYNKAVVLEKLGRKQEARSCQEWALSLEAQAG